MNYKLPNGLDAYFAKTKKLDIQVFLNQRKLVSTKIMNPQYIAPTMETSANIFCHTFQINNSAERLCIWSSAGKWCVEGVSWNLLQVNSQYFLERWMNFKILSKISHMLQNKLTSYLISSSWVMSCKMWADTHLDFANNTLNYSYFKCV